MDVTWWLSNVHCIYWGARGPHVVLLVWRGRDSTPKLSGQYNGNPPEPFPRLLPQPTAQDIEFSCQAVYSWLESFNHSCEVTSSVLIAFSPAYLLSLPSGYCSPSWSGQSLRLAQIPQPTHASKPSLPWIHRHHSWTMPSFSDGGLCFLDPSQVLWKPHQAAVVPQEKTVLVRHLVSHIQLGRHETQLSISRAFNLERSSTDFPRQGQHFTVWPWSQRQLRKGNQTHAKQSLHRCRGHCHWHTDFDLSTSGFPEYY